MLERGPGDDQPVHLATEGVTLRELRLALHDLCQPLSALQCRLYLGTLDDDPSSMREAIAESVTECERMIELVRDLQDMVRG